MAAANLQPLQARPFEEHGRAQIQIEDEDADCEDDYGVDDVEEGDINSISNINSNRNISYNSSMINTAEHGVVVAAASRTSELTLSFEGSEKNRRRDALTRKLGTAYEKRSHRGCIVRMASLHPRTLCNACGLMWANKGTLRDVSKGGRSLSMDQLEPETPMDVKPSILDGEFSGNQDENGTPEDPSKAVHQGSSNPSIDPDEEEPLVELANPSDTDIDGSRIWLLTLM